MKTDQLHQFFVLHEQSCGVVADMDVLDGCVDVRSRCPTCGAEVTVPLTVDEAAAMHADAENAETFLGAIRRARRRVIQ